MSQHQLRHRAVAALVATAAALAPVADLLAKRRPRRRQNAAEDEDDDDLIRRRLRRRRNEQDDDDDERLTSLVRARRRKKANDDEDERGDDADATAAANSPQGIVADLGIRDLVQERLDNALSGGGGGGSDEPNIEVSQDGDSIIVVTKDIEFAADSEGMEVETGGISYVSGAGGGVLDEFDS